jgi:hypothetical protein
MCIFSKTAKMLVDRRFGRGGKKLISDRMNIQPSYLSDLLGGRRTWTDDMKDSFARAVRLSLIDLFNMAVSLDREGCIFPYPDKVYETRPYSKERAVVIFKLAAERYCIDIPWVFNDGILCRSPFGVILEQYRQAQITDAVLHEKACYIYCQIQKA